MFDNMSTNLEQKPPTKEVLNGTAVSAAVAALAIQEVHHQCLFRQVTQSSKYGTLVHFCQMIHFLTL